MFCDAFGNRCEGHIFARFCFHSVLSLRNGSVVRPAAAFPDFAQGKRGVPSAQDNRQGSRRMSAAVLEIFPRFPKLTRYGGGDVLKGDSFFPCRRQCALFSLIPLKSMRIFAVHSWLPKSTP